MRHTEQLCPLPVRAPLSVTCPCPPVRYLLAPCEQPCPLPVRAPPVRHMRYLSVTCPCPLFVICGWLFYGFRRGKERFLMVSVVARERFLMVSVVARERFLMVSVVARERFLMVSVVAGNVFLWFPSLLFLWFPSWQGTLFMVSVVGVFYGFRLLQDRGCLSDGNRKKTTRTFPRRTKYIYIYIYMCLCYCCLFLWFCMYKYLPE